MNPPPNLPRPLFSAGTEFPVGEPPRRRWRTLAKPLPASVRLLISIASIVAIIAVLRSQPNDTAGIAGKIVYVEYQAADLAKTRAFFEQAFGWNFAQQSPTRVTFFDGRLGGGFTKSDRSGKRANGAALVSIYCDNLEATRRKVLSQGGKVVQEIADTTEARRFIFEEPSGNEFVAVASK